MGIFSLKKMPNAQAGFKQMMSNLSWEPELIQNIPNGFHSPYKHPIS